MDEYDLLIEINKKSKIGLRVNDKLICVSYEGNSLSVDDETFIEGLFERAKEQPTEKKLLKAPDFFYFSSLINYMFDCNDNSIFAYNHRVNSLRLYEEASDRILTTNKTPCGFKKTTYGELKKGDLFTNRLDEVELSNFRMKIEKGHYYLFINTLNQTSYNNYEYDCDSIVYKVCPLDSGECDVYES